MVGKRPTVPAEQVLFNAVREQPRRWAKHFPYQRAGGAAFPSTTSMLPQDPVCDLINSGLSLPFFAFLASLTGLKNYAKSSLAF